MRTVDPITLSTTWHFIQRVCREMRETAERTATNMLVVTLHDLAYGIWDAEGRAIAIPEGFPPRLISSTFPIRKTMKKFEGRIYPGDIFLTNMPWDGAVHLADWAFIRPIFYKSELVFWTCMGTHVPDSGGAHAGGHALVDDRVAEGLNIPLIKIVERGEWREDVAELILANNRLPKMMRHEMSSLMGSTAVAERRMIELLDRYGKETVYDCAEAMIERTEKAVRNEMKKWPEGTWETVVQTDGESISSIPITIRCKLTIKDGEATFDFSDTDKECSGNTNAYYHQTLSDVMCTTFLFLGSELAAFHNEGSMRPIHVITRKGTLVDCTDECLVAEAPAVIGGLTIEAVLSVLSQALPERAIAAYARLSAPVLVGRDESVDGFMCILSFSAVAGAGAVYGYDGYQCACDMGTLGVVGKVRCRGRNGPLPLGSSSLRIQYRFARRRKVARQPWNYLGSCEYGGRLFSMRRTDGWIFHPGFRGGRRLTDSAEQGLYHTGRKTDRTQRTPRDVPRSSMEIIFVSCPAVAAVSDFRQREIPKPFWRTSGTNWYPSRWREMCIKSLSTRNL